MTIVIMLMLINDDDDDDDDDDTDNDDDDDDDDDDVDHANDGDDDICFTEPHGDTTSQTPTATTAAAAITTITATTTTVTASATTNMTTATATITDTTTASTTTTTIATAATVTTATTSSQQTPSHPTTTSSLPSTHTSSASSTLPHTHTPRAVDVMTATPHKVFVTTPVSARDVWTPWITSIVSTQDEKLVMADCDNNKVKVVDISHQHTVSASLTVEEAPWGLAVLSDCLVAVTTLKPTIYLLKVSPTLAVTTQIQTGRQYGGVGEGLTDHTLLVSCGKTYSEPARVDLITRGGEVVRTVVDSTMLTQLSAPFYLCVSGGCVLLSDWGAQAVFTVDVTTGQLVDTLTHTDMDLPGQVCVIGEGNIYIASADGRCVLVRSTGKQWRRVVYSPDHTDQGCYWPFGVCVTRSGRLVVAWGKGDSHCVVTGYDLK